MAYIQPIYICAFVVALAACNEIIFTEGRQLKSKETFPPATSSNQNLGFGASVVEVYEDDFRPTTPGNSPGVGHNGDVQGKAPGSFSQTVAGNSNEFRPTNPGHSPGVGHSTQSGNK